MQDSPHTPPERPGRGLFFRIRVAVLLTVLAIVVVYACHDVWARRARNDWKRTLHVAVVVVRDGPVTSEAVERLRTRAPVLEQRLAEELSRYRPSSPRPFQFSVFGPIDGAPPPPSAPSAPGWVDTVRYQLSLDAWAHDIDARGAYGGKGYDTTIYLYARPPDDARRKEIEGSSEEGGRLGVVRVELDETMTDFTLFVATHETLHTLGATDKYAADGAIFVPDGLAEPALVPLYPQRFAEVMARHRAVGPGLSKPPTSLLQLAVGLRTAEEIGWRR